MIKTTRKGFTLIELMVVIVIIGILATLGLLTYQNAIKRARDSKRTGDIKDIATAQEQLKALGGSYVAHTTVTPCAVSGSVIGTLSLPTDPINTSPNQYTCYMDTNNFCVSARLEGTNDGNCTGCTSTTNYNTSAGANNSYCVKSKQ